MYHQNKCSSSRINEVVVVGINQSKKELFIMKWNM